MDASCGEGVLAGVGQGDGPVFLVVVIVKSDAGFASEAEGDVAGHPEVVAEEVLDDVAFVAEAKDEILVAVGGVGFHDVPKDGTVADGNHGFGAVFGLLAQTGAFATAEYNDFH